MRTPLILYSPYPECTPKKWPLNPFAEPIAELGHHRPELEFLVLFLVERPGIVIAGQFERGLLAQTDFEPHVERTGRSPV